jgi:hypothetical protein
MDRVAGQVVELGPEGIGRVAGPGRRVELGHVRRRVGEDLAGAGHVLGGRAQRGGVAGRRVEAERGNSRTGTCPSRVRSSGGSWTRGAGRYIIIDRYATIDRIRVILMADGFEVDIATLRALSGELTSIGDRVGTAQHGMDGLGDDQTGDGDLTGAVHHFKDKWEYSLKKIRETAEKTAEKVTSAADGYDQVDTAVANAAAGKS